MSVSVKRRLQVYDWLDTPAEERMPQTQFRKSIKMSFKKFLEVKNEWREQRQNQPARSVREVAGMIDRTLDEGGDERWTSVEQAIYEQAVKGTVKAQELFAKLKGKLIDKQEIRVGRLEDDDYYRIRNEARRELNQTREKGNKGAGEVRAIPALLLEQPCLDREQDERQDS